MPSREELRARAEALGFDPAWGDVALARLERRRSEAGKRCSSCGEFRPLSAFGRRSGGAMGLDNRCKPCRSAGDARTYARRHSV